MAGNQRRNVTLGRYLVQILCKKDSRRFVASAPERNRSWNRSRACITLGRTFVPTAACSLWG